MRLPFRSGPRITLAVMGVIAATVAVSCSSSSTETGASSPVPAADASSLDARTTDGAALADVVGSDVRSDAVVCKLTKPYSTKNKACNDCAASECCAAVNQCLGNVECDDHYVNCILACALLPDDAGPDAGAAAILACESACGDQYPEGHAVYENAIGCVDQQCAAQCGGN